jgi:type IV pilus assembly protein PilO
MALMKVVDKIIDRPKVHVYMGMVLVLLMIAYAWWAFVVGPVYASASEAETKVSDLQIKKAEAVRIARNLPKYREEVKEYDAKLVGLLKELPDKRQIPSLLNSVEGLAHDTGLEVTKFVTQPEVLSDFFARVPVFVETQGTFHQLITFFDEVAHLDRIINIDSLDTTIVTEAPEKITIAASFRATTFRYLDESEIKKIEDEKKQGRGERGKRG